MGIETEHPVKPDLVINIDEKPLTWGNQSVQLVVEAGQIPRPVQVLPLLLIKKLTNFFEKKK